MHHSGEEVVELSFPPLYSTFSDASLVDKSKEVFGNKSFSTKVGIPWYFFSLSFDSS